MPAPRLSLRVQLLLAFGLILLASVGVGWLGFSTTQADGTASIWVSHTQIVIDAADDALITLDDMEDRYREYMLTGSASALADYQARSQQYPGQLENLGSLTADNPPQVARWQALAEQIDSLRSQVLEPGIALRQREAEGLVTIGDVIQFSTLNTEQPALNAIREEFGDATDVERGLLVGRVQVADADNTVLQNVLLWGTLSRLLVGMCIAALAVETIGSAMGKLASGAQAIAAGDLSRRINLHRYDEIGRAADAFDSMAAVLQKDRIDRQAVEQIKDEFISVVSHELRTPLTSIRGALGLLQSGLLGPLPTKATRMLDVALTNTDRLIRLINDILDIERIDSGRATIELREIDARGLVVRSIESIKPLSDAARIKIIEHAESLELMADADRLVQTLTNLISNAIKFSPPDSTIVVSVRREGPVALFSVQDHGRGIPSDKLDSIFSRFEQVDASDSREKGGTGLGLAIARTIVEQHGGHIWAESVLGEGSTFHFTVPLADPADPQEMPLDAEDLTRVIGDTFSQQGVVPTVEPNPV